MTHFASRLGLDQSSVRGIPARGDDTISALLRENARLRARVGELELALEALRSASATVPSSASATQKIKTAPTVTTAKPKDEPWVAMGLSRRTYFRRKAAGQLKEA